MKSLILIRHAKSDWGMNMADIDRPLMHSGIRDAHLVAEIATNCIPNSYKIWCSIAKRAYETCLIFAKVFKFPETQIIFREELYTFDGNALANKIKSASEEIATLIVFGHNEAITDFVNKFGDIYIDNVPTSGYVTITFETDSWQNLAKGKTGKIIFPRDLR